MKPFQAKPFPRLIIPAHIPPVPLRLLAAIFVTYSPASWLSNVCSPLVSPVQKYVSGVGYE